MKTLRNDYCLRMFTGLDTLRPALSRVNLNNGYLYATNAHVLAKINASECVKKYENFPSYPECEKVLSQHKKSESLEIKTSVLFDCLMKIECCYSPDKINCADCGGSGDDICEYCDSEHDCKNCDGSGKVDGEKLVPNGDYKCDFFNRLYQLKYMDLVIRAAVTIGAEKIKVINGEGKFSGTLFLVGDFTILLMPTS